MEHVEQNWKTKTKRFLKECARVLKITKKPNAEEFKTICKMAALGMAIIGIIGFFIQLGKQILF